MDFASTVTLRKGKRRICEPRCHEAIQRLSLRCASGRHLQPLSRTIHRPPLFWYLRFTAAQATRWAALSRSLRLSAGYCAHALLNADR